MSVSRIVSTFYFFLGVLAFVIFEKTLDWLWANVDVLQHQEIIGRTVTLATVIALGLAVGLTLYLYRMREAYQYFSEVVIELEKVTWPDFDETKRNTLVVIVFTVVLSGFLFLSDQVWLFFSNQILGGV